MAALGEHGLARLEPNRDEVVDDDRPAQAVNVEVDHVDADPVHLARLKQVINLVSSGLTAAHGCEDGQEVPVAQITLHYVLWCHALLLENDRVGVDLASPLPDDTLVGISLVIGHLSVKLVTNRAQLRCKSGVAVGLSLGYNVSDPFRPIPQLLLIPGAGLI